MTDLINETHDVRLTSWVESAQTKATDFPIQNLPFAVFRRRQSAETFRIGVAIGDQILDITQAVKLGAFSSFDATTQQAAQAACSDTLNALMRLGHTAWHALRLALSHILRSGSKHKDVLQSALVAQDEAEYALPAQIGDYTDFYTSIYHATSVGKQFRPDNPLLPNYDWVPIGYHGRASSIDVSGQHFKRPIGQLRSATPGEPPRFAPCERLDYELELGIFIGAGNALGEPVDMASAASHVFGLCLFNDWSARDIQAWEYQPLGPFLAKNFASTISPWIVTLEALAPYRCAFKRPEGTPEPLPYLSSPDLKKNGALDIQLAVYLQTENMRSQGLAAQQLSQSNYCDAFWTVEQMVTHHTVNGCNLRPGDLFGTGTLSGPAPEEAGSLLELSVGGKNPIPLKDGSTRTFLADGDTVIMKGWAHKEGYARIGFGEVSGTVLPARNV